MEHTHSCFHRRFHCCRLRNVTVILLVANLPRPKNVDKFRSHYSCSAARRAQNKQDFERLYCDFGLVLSLKSIPLSSPFRMDTYPYLVSSLDMTFDKFTCVNYSRFCELYGAASDTVFAKNQPLRRANKHLRRSNQSFRIKSVWLELKPIHHCIHRTQNNSFEEKWYQL